MTYLPFKNTNISARQSMGEIQIMLEENGFEQTAVVFDRGVSKIFAVYHGAPFHFEVDIEIVKAKLISSLGARTQTYIRQKDRRGSRAVELVNEQAPKIGWRLMANHFKTLCDAIKLGVISPSQAFAGYLYDARSKKTLAEQITESIETGKMMPTNLLEFGGQK